MAQNNATNQAFDQINWKETFDRIYPAAARSWLAMHTDNFDREKMRAHSKRIKEDPSYKAKVTTEIANMIVVIATK